MKYRITCLTPTLIGDGQKLAPIDYMVWKDHVNVLDQRRIFRLLSRGPRLEGYLAQLKKADRLEFAEWGGFAQNFAGRRIPFESPAVIPHWQKAHPEQLFISTFATSPTGPYIPGTAIKGALRTGAVHDRWTSATLRDLAERLESLDRMPKNPAYKAEDAVLGGSGSNRMRRISVADSESVTPAAMKVYLLRVSTLAARGGGKLELAWKSERGSVEARRVEDSTPIFAEMATPGSSFEGGWSEKSVSDRARLFQASNKYAAAQLAKHKEYAELAGMPALASTIGELETRSASASSGNQSCLLSIGWGGGILGKSAYLDTADEEYRRILRQMPVYQKALQSGLPFPKTRKVIFEGSQAAALPGWVLLEVFEK